MIEARHAQRNFAEGLPRKSETCGRTGCERRISDSTTSNC